jgi:hypothetical protein
MVSRVVHWGLVGIDWVLGIDWVRVGKGCAVRF